MSQYEANPNTPQMPPQNHPVNQMPYGNGGRPPMPPQQGYAPQNQYPPQQPVYPNGYQGAPYYQPPQQPQQPKKANGGKIALILLCLLMVVGIGLLMADQYDLFAAEEPHMQQGSNLPPADFQENSNAGSEHSVHNWMDATCVSPAYCTSCGAVEGEPREHQWAEATYNEARACKVCGKSDGSPKTPGSSLNIHDIIWHAEASSVYSGDNLGDHTPEKLYDGKLNTNWTEDASGKGIGEYVILYFDDVYAVRKMHIYIGSHYSKNVYEQNCRPRTIQVTFSDGSTDRIQLKDTYDEQIVVFDQYHYTDSVKLTIEEVYTGTKYQDTVIAELDFVAYRP